MPIRIIVAKEQLPICHLSKICKNKTLNRSYWLPLFCLHCLNFEEKSSLDCETQEKVHIQNLVYYGKSDLRILKIS